jgi:GMP synthase-like glutamine amidotransferase
MERELKVYVVGTQTGYTRFLKNFKLVDNIKDADLVLFTGGEDVDPSLYGKEKHRTTYSNIHRDLAELSAFKQIQPNQVVLGICRGSQFLCVANGGILVQDCDNHAIWGTHEIIDTKTGDVYEITSTHHQMQYPYTLRDEDYTLLFKAAPFRSSHYYGDGVEEKVIRSKGEAEIVLYHRPGFPKCLAVQGHPEMIPDSPIADRINSLIREIM